MQRKCSPTSSSKQAATKVAIQTVYLHQPWIQHCCAGWQMGHLRSIQGFPSIMPHGMVEMPHDKYFSFSLLCRLLSWKRTRCSWPRCCRRTRRTCVRRLWLPSRPNKRSKGDPSCTQQHIVTSSLMLLPTHIATGHRVRPLALADPTQ